MRTSSLFSKSALRLLLLLPSLAGAFYVPGVAVKTFAKDQPVELKVNAITSQHTQVPRSFYSLPVCHPENGIKNKSENLGEFLTGNKIQNSPFKLNMKRDVYCEILCVVELKEKDAKKLDLAIRYEYHNNWIVDNLPSYAQGHTRTGKEGKRFGGGFPIGVYLKEELPTPAVTTTTTKKDKKKAKKEFKKKFKKIEKKKGVSYVYNHFKIILDYHQPDKSIDGYRIVGFGVEPMSVNHIISEESKSRPLSKSALKTCSKSKTKEMQHHLEIGEIHSGGMKAEKGSKILYTYDVMWKESPTTWATRWDVYLKETDAEYKSFHWMALVNSLFLMFVAGSTLAGILIKRLKNDFAEYNAVLTDEEMDEDYEESGWKLIHADVFRAPEYPMFFSVAVSSGLQIVLTTIPTIFFALVGLLSPARRGSFVTCFLVCYMLCGVVAGYVSSRFYKTFRGKSWQLCTVITACFFPGSCLFLFLIFNTYTAFLHSSLSVPFLDLLLMVVMFCGVLIPLVFFGAFIGYKQDPFEYPTRISTVPRAIPKLPFYKNSGVMAMVCGMVAFSAIFLEIQFVLDGLWTGEFYYIFGFLSAVGFVMLGITVEVSILFCYFQFLNEDHKWWWPSFFSGGSSSIFFFMYTIYYYGELQTSSMFITYFLYFGYSFIMSIILFLGSGSVSFLSCFWFARKIFGAIKAD